MQILSLHKKANKKKLVIYFNMLINLMVSEQTSYRVGGNIDYVNGGQ